MPCALNLASASASGTKTLVWGSSRVAADTLQLPGTRPGRPYRLGSRPLWNCGPSALTTTVLRSPLEASTSCLPAKYPLFGFAVNVAGLYPLAGPVSMARPSAFHLSNPPSSTAAFSKPSEESIHQKRVAHIGVPKL